jgi:predicted 3-demethylubiquinone-9 3-methyltransferase (glyoxalase superfamily)
MTMQKITPCLWFDSQAEEATNLYVETFRNAPKGSAGDSKIISTTRYSSEAAEVSGRPAGSVLTVSFMLDGQEFIALNGGPIFKFSEAISLSVSCDTQEELDYFWNAFVKNGGEESQCGWLKDRYGLSWQIVPSVLPELLTSEDAAKARRVTAALLDMKKLDIAALQNA